MILAVLAATAFSAHAQRGGGSGSGDPYLPWRGNDPFLFCTKGMIGVDYHGWIPLNPVTGTFTITDYYTYQARGIPSSTWYATNCPRAMGQGKWDGPGDGSQVPYRH